MANPPRIGNKTGLVPPGRPFNQPPRSMPKTGLPVVPTDRGTATAHAPNTLQGDLRTVLQTFFTKADLDAQIIYNGDRLWAKVTLTLEDAGPVSVGTMADLFPVLSGKGILLAPNRPAEFVIGKGSILYIAATAVNRVSMQIEPLPWLEQITGTLRDYSDKALALLTKLVNKLAS